MTKKTPKLHPNPIFNIHSLLYKFRTRKVWWTCLAQERWFSFRAFNVHHLLSGWMNVVGKHSIQRGSYVFRRRASNTRRP